MAENAACEQAQNNASKLRQEAQQKGYAMDTLVIEDLNEDHGLITSKTDKDRHNKMRKLGEELGKLAVKLDESVLDVQSKCTFDNTTSRGRTSTRDY